MILTHGLRVHKSFEKVVFNSQISRGLFNDVNLCNCHYPVVKQVAHEQHKIQRSQSFIVNTTWPSTAYSENSMALERISTDFF